MTNAAGLERELRRAIEGVDIEREGADRYIVHVPFMFDDGDHPVIVLKKRGGRWLFTDEGHTLMRAGGGGEMCVEVAEGRRGSALLAFVKAIMKVDQDSSNTPP